MKHIIKRINTIKNNNDISYILKYKSIMFLLYLDSFDIPIYIVEYKHHSRTVLIRWQKRTHTYFIISIHEDGIYSMSHKSAFCLYSSRCFNDMNTDTRTIDYIKDKVSKTCV